MSYVTTVAEHVPTLEKVMLTCFLCNDKAKAFYEKMGFGVDDSSPGERKLRGGKVVVPDYTIMSRKTQRCRRIT
jgi:RimJ/RimL family protein N-acetyltransferase